MTRNVSLAGLLICLVALCLLLPGAWLRAQSAPTGEQQLLAADRGILEAMTGSHPDENRLSHALAPEYLDVENGEAHTRAEVLQHLPKLSDFRFEYNNPHAVLLSANTGYVTADVDYAYSYVSKHELAITTFVLRGGQWLAALHVESPRKDDRAAVLATPADSEPAVLAMRRLAVEVMSQVHVPGYGPFPFYPVLLDAGTAISFSNGEQAHEADFTTLPPPMQQVWTQWASYTADEPSGEALFKDMFYRFFLVHELGHMIAGRVVAGLPEAERARTSTNMAANAVEKELVPNRIAVAWFREHDPQYLARLINDFRVIEAHLPNPVPAGANPKRYFTESYLRLASDPKAYGWYQLYMVLSVFDEPPKGFQQVLNELPSLRYD